MTDLGIHIGAVRLDNPLILAPLAGVTNLPFRILAKEQGAGLTVTEMVSAMGLCQRGPKTMKLMDTDPIEKPFCVQLFGKNPEVLARATELAQEAGADIVDLNMGCPARKVVRHGSGSALLKDFDLVEKILTAMRRVCKVPFTVKTRAGWKVGEGSVLELAAILTDCGVDAVTLHPRFAQQMFAGTADWDIIAQLVERFPGPVIGNGDVTRPWQVRERMDQTGCAGVMIGRAAMGNPWFFKKALALLEGRTPEEPAYTERLAAARRHAVMMAERHGRDRAVYMMRSVLMWYTKGLPASTTFRRSINQVKDFDVLLEMMDSYFESLAEPEIPEAMAG